MVLKCGYFLLSFLFLAFFSYICSMEVQMLRATQNQIMNHGTINSIAAQQMIRTSVTVPNAALKKSLDDDDFWPSD